MSIEEISKQDKRKVCNPNMFRRTFALFGFLRDMSEDIRNQIQRCGGVTIEYDNVSQSLDYLVVSLDTNTSTIPMQCKPTYVVTNLWLNDCIVDNRLVKIENFHRPITLTKNRKALRLLTIVMSNYTGSERKYLTGVAKSLGAVTSEIWMKKHRPITISPSAEGEKYNAAIKWDLPVVTSDWLMKCLELEEEVALTPYLVGESKWSNNSKDTTTWIDESEMTTVIAKTRKRKGPRYDTPLTTQNRFTILEPDSDDDVTPIKKVMVTGDHGNNKAIVYPFDEERLACIDQILMKYQKL